MNGPARLDAERRARLVADLGERARLLRLPDELIAKALVRCLARGDGRSQGHAGGPPGNTAPVSDLSAAFPIATEPSSSNTPPMPMPVPTPMSMSAPTPVPTQVATALTELGEASAPSAMTVVDRPVTAVPGSSDPAFHDALTPRSLARLTDESGQWDALTEGTIIAGYRIESALGAGAMGQVYRATQLSMNRVVAFKVLAPKLSANRKFRERFVREARAAGRLHHPNLIAVHDVGEADGLMFFSMELVDGTTVAELLRRHGRIPEMRALEICRQALEALKFAHSNGVVHRDIKPDNLMVTKVGMVKVADLGLARAEDAEDASITATNVGQVMGTPHYMAPEQGRDAHGVDHRADLYAVGATLFHLVCGHTPFTGDSAMEVLMRSASQPLKFPEPGPSPAVRVLISRLMEKEPADRPQSAAEAIEMVSKLRRKQVDDDPESAPSAAEAVVRARRRRLRRTMRKVSWYAFGLSLVVVAIVVVLGISGGWQWSSTQDEVAKLTKANRYRDAVVLLDRQQPGVTAPAREITRIRAEVERAWDSWAYLQVQNIFKTVAEHLGQRRLADAYTALQSISDNLKSPGVRLDYDSYQRKWEEAMLAEEASTAKPPDDTRVRELWPQEYVNHLGADLLHTVTWRPPTNVVMSENTVRLTSTGNARCDVSASASGRALRFNVRFPDKDHGTDQWALPFPDGHTLVVGRGGITLTGVGEPRVLAKESDQYAFALQFDRDAVEIQPPGVNRWLPIAKPTKDWVMSWDVGPNRSIDIRLRVIPVRVRK
ncbi:MAG: serine/threonine protein kinase [Planctomycetes bacterium]|jgi:serine/threonine protein kinase|nr:serine/threonine protein kinase [Planctomycetota bacterium]